MELRPGLSEHINECKVIPYQESYHAPQWELLIFLKMPLYMQLQSTDIYYRVFLLGFSIYVIDPQLNTGGRVSYPANWCPELLTEFLSLLWRHDYVSKTDIASASEQWIKYLSYSFSLVLSNRDSLVRNQKATYLKNHSHGSRHLFLSTSNWMAETPEIVVVTTTST